MDKSLNKNVRVELSFVDNNFAHEGMSKKPPMSFDKVQGDNTFVHCLSNSIFVVLTLLANILCVPLWTELDYGSFIKTFFNKEARLELFYEGKISGESPFQFQITPQPLNSPSPYLSAITNLQRLNLDFRARGKYQKLSLQLKSQRDGKITLGLQGPFIFDDYGHIYSVLTDWRNLKINGKTILSQDQAFSFKKNFTKQLSVKKGDVLHIEAEFRRHHFSIHDFTLLKSGKIWYFITGNLLLFFLIYRLSSCVRGGGIRRVDALFLAIFFLLSFIPMINISDAVQSVRENRKLAVKPEWKDIVKEKPDYGRRYEEWFNDHFYARTALIKLHDVIRNRLSHVIRTKDALYSKDSGWLFIKPFLVRHWDFNLTLSKSIVQSLIRLDEFCQQNNIKFYVLEVPRKECIYKDICMNELGFDEKKFFGISRAQEAIRNEARKHHIPYIYPCKALRDAANTDFVFFKWTHHWTDWGAFIGYCELMKEIYKDFPDMPIVSLNDYQKSQNRLIRDRFYRQYELGNTGKYFNFSDDPLKRSIYNYYDHRNGDKMMIQVGKFTKDFTYLGGKRKVMLIGSSQNENFLQFLPYSAALTKYIRLNMGQVKTSDEFKIMKLYKKDILSFKPNILILSIYEGELPKLRDLCSTK